MKFLLASAFFFTSVLSIRFGNSTYTYPYFNFLEASYCTAPPLKVNMLNLTLVIAPPNPNVPGNLPDACNPLPSGYEGKAVLAVGSYCATSVAATNVANSGAAAFITYGTATAPVPLLAPASLTVPLNITCFSIPLSIFTQLFAAVGAQIPTSTYIYQEPLQANQSVGLQDLFALANENNTNDSCTYTNPTIPSRPGIWGFYCTDEGMISRASLITNNVVGQLPESLGNWTEITYFSYSGFTTTTGVIPLSWSSWKKLYSFTLTGTSITSLSQLVLANWTSLQTLTVNSNRFTDIIPLAFARPSLQTVVFADNQLVGDIPDLSGLTGLQVLDLSGNLLTISNVTKFPNLTTVVLEQNLIADIPPSVWATNAAVQTLIIDQNQLTSLNISRLPSLVTLDASSNLLTNITWGSIPPTRIRTLKLSNNSLSNVNFAQLPLTTLDISKNNFSGPLANIFPASLTTLQASHNKFTNLPGRLAINAIVNLDLSYNEMTDVLEEFFFKFLRNAVTNLQLSHNHFRGQGAVGGLFPVLVSFNASYNNLSYPVNNVVPSTLTTLDVSHNSQIDRILDTLFSGSLQTANFDNNKMDYNRDSNPGVDILPSSILFGYEKTSELDTNENGLECPSFTIVGKSMSQVKLDPAYHHYYLCRCAPGFFHKEGVFNSCTPCLTHGRCDGMVNPLQLGRGLNILASQGYFPVPDVNNPQALLECRFGTVMGNSEFNPCNWNASKIVQNVTLDYSVYISGTQPYPGDSLGQDTSFRFTCAEGYGDRLCSRCLDGYFRKSGLCLRCSDRVDYQLFVTVLVFVLACAVGYFALRSPVDTSIRSKNPKSWSFVFQNPILVDLVPIVLTHFQTQTIVTSKLESLNLVRNIQSFLGVVVLSSPNSGLGLECGPSFFTDFIVEYKTTVIFPAIFVGCLCLGFFLKFMLLICLRRLTKERLRQEFYQWLYGVGSFLNTIYFPLSLFVINAFQCSTDPVSGIEYLSDRPYLRCDDISWEAKIIPLIIYPFGIYALLTILTAYLTLAPPQVKENEFFVQSFGDWAYLQFKPNRIFCLCYFLTVRLYLSLIVGLVASDYDYFLLLIAVGLFADLLGCLYFTPFVSQTWNRVKFISSVVVLFVFINAIVATFPPVQSTSAPVVVYFILNIAIVIYFLYSMKREHYIRSRKIATSKVDLISTFGVWHSGRSPIDPVRSPRQVPPLAHQSTRNNNGVELQPLDNKPQTTTILDAQQFLSPPPRPNSPNSPAQAPSPDEQTPLHAKDEPIQPNTPKNREEDVDADTDESEGEEDVKNVTHPHFDDYSRHTTPSFATLPPTSPVPPQSPHVVVHRSTSDFA